MRDGAYSMLNSRYSKFANVALGLSFIIFALSILLKYFWGDIFAVNLLFSVSEAALIGGVADWFAVTALFRKPLGFPYHTAIIPRNREKVIDSIAGMVEEHFLSVDSIKSWLERTQIVESIINWLDRSNGNQLFRSLLVRFSRDIFIKISHSKIPVYLERLLKDSVKEIRLWPQIKDFIGRVTEDGEDDKWIAYLIHQLSEAVGKPSVRDWIYGFLVNLIDENTKGSLWKVIGKIAEKSNVVNISEAADALHNGLIRVLHDMNNPEHPLRSRLREMSVEIISKLETGTSLCYAIESWKEEAVERLQFQKLLESMISPAGERSDCVSSETSKTEQFTVLMWIADQLDSYWKRFKQDQKMKERLEKYIIEVILSIIKSEGHLIGSFVKETLSAFTDEKLNQFLEDKAGNDLQWIRINGSLVGALVGLLIFLFVNLFYDPFILPLLQMWMM